MSMRRMPGWHSFVWPRQVLGCCNIRRGGKEMAGLGSWTAGRGDRPAQPINKTLVREQVDMISRELRSLKLGTC